MTWQDFIVHDPNICHGRATVKGTRIMVSVVLANLAAGHTEIEIIAGFPRLTSEQIRACLGYAAWLAMDEIVRMPEASTA